MIFQRLTTAVILLLAAFAAAAQQAWVTKTVHDYRIALAVETIFAPSLPGEDPRHARTFEHRLLVSILEEPTRRPATLASVSADVAESGYTGVSIPLSPVRSGENGTYEGRVRLANWTSYRILVHAAPADGGRTLEAQFGYRHHH